MSLEQPIRADASTGPRNLALRQRPVLGAYGKSPACPGYPLVGGDRQLGSGKFEIVLGQVDSLMAEGHKVLLFSQFVECLKLLAAEFDEREVRYHMLTGSTRNREEVVTAFQEEADPSVFLISLKAGSTGLNLTSASYVILFDPWWNPAVEAQAIDRTHRIGQKDTVFAYRMISTGTIEEKIAELQEHKAKMLRDVLSEQSFAGTLTRDDLSYLLEDPESRRDQSEVFHHSH